MKRGYVALLVGVLVFLQGCAGLAVGTYGKHEYEFDQVALRDERGRLGWRVPDDGYSKGDIVRLWGTPDGLSDKGACTVLSYKGGVSWAGFGVFLGLFPLPVVVPTGRYETRIYLRDDTAVRVVREVGEVGLAAGFMCGSNECSWIFGRTPSPPEKRVEVDWCGS